ncbi:MAG: alpha/beta hydrolase [Chitinophagaceae bacterium]|nr:alpha/beta hydrolase [Chitinophagaceae bacterium]
MNAEILKRNNVQVYGSGKRTMVFAHGFGCDQKMWRFVWPAFQDEYRIVLFDYVGCGGSDLTSYNAQRYSNLNGFAEDILDVCNALDIQNAVFVGHSVSSIIGVLAAIKQPALFSHLLLVGPSAKYINEPGYVGGFERADIVELLNTMEKNYVGWANFLAPAIMKNNEQPELTEELTASFCAVDPEVARNFAKATFFSDNRADLANISHPTLIMQCTDDLIAPMEVGEYLHKNISNSELRVLAATGHCPHMSAPEETIAVMKDYLAKHVN